MWEDDEEEGQAEEPFSPDQYEYDDDEDDDEASISTHEHWRRQDQVSSHRFQLIKLHDSESRGTVRKNM